MSYAGTCFITLPVFTAIARLFNDAELQLWEQFFRPEGADHYFQVLLTSTPWQQRMRKMYDRIVPDPRFTAYYGGANGHPWSKILLEIKDNV